MRVLHSVGKRGLSKGFSLIELVVVIAILGILTSIALPLFSNIRRDAYISQIKNVLVSIVKECKVAQIRGTSTLLGDIPTARASIPAYRIGSQGVVGQALLQRDCFTPGVFVSGYTGPRTAISLSASPVDASGQVDTSLSPIFYIAYVELEGATLRTCQISQNTAYTHGCTAQFSSAIGVDQSGQPIYPANNGWGVW